MAKKEIFNCAYLEVAIERPFTSTAPSPEHWVAAAQDVVAQIKRHVDGVSHININDDIDEVCEFCLCGWTEDNDLYNGGCCDKDETSQDTPK